jgi:hypothetical protein
VIQYVTSPLLVFILFTTQACNNTPCRLAMAELEYTIFIRVPRPRRDFVDPPTVRWDTSKDVELWNILSGAAQTEIDCLPNIHTTNPDPDFRLTHTPAHRDSMPPSPFSSSKSPTSPTVMRRRSAPRFERPPLPSPPPSRVPVPRHRPFQGVSRLGGRRPVTTAPRRLCPSAATRPCPVPSPADTTAAPELQSAPAIDQTSRATLPARR